MNDAAIRSTEAPVWGVWLRDGQNRVVSVTCECGDTIYRQGATHARYVHTDGVAKCKRCRRLVRVPVGYVDTV